MSHGMEEKRFHLQRMQAEGLTARRAHELYGGPCRETLKKWRKEWEGGLIECEMPRVPGACEHRKHEPLPAETKGEALRLLASGKPSREVDAMLGLPGGTASRWAREGRRATMPPPGAEGAPGAKGAKVAGSGDLEARVAELEEQNAVLRELMRDPKVGDPAGTRRG